MSSVKKNLDIIFERNLKWRLHKKAYTSADGIKVLINSFRYYDLTNTGKINKEKWVDAILYNGLIIGISKEDLGNLFDKYKEENTDLIDYKKFAFDIFFKYQNKISLNKINLTNNYNNLYNKTESINNLKNFNRNNNNLNINETRDISKSQNIININNKFNDSFNLYNNIYENSRYNYTNTSSNKLNNSISGIDYSTTHSNSIKNSVNYFRSKININNGLNYYRFISELKSKYSNDNKILKNYLPIALQNIGVFYTQKELVNLFYALGCEDITINTFSLSKIIELLKEEMNTYRKNIITNIFNSICKKENINGNEISIKILKEQFRPEMHPEVLNHRRNPNDIYIQFCESLDIYAKLNNILNNINLDQFIEFYSGISASIIDDRYFAYVLNNVFPNNDNKIENNNENDKLKLKESSTSPKINLNVDKFNINDNKEENNNLNEDNLNRNSFIKERMNNYSHTKINLPLFYYNKKENLNNTSKSNNITDKKDFNININNSVFTPNSKRIDSKIYENNRQNYTSENNLRNRSEPTSPYYNNINTNLINQDLNLIGSNNGFNNKDISSIINKIREIFILRGIKSIFYFQKMLYVYDINHTGEISFTNLQNIIQAYNYNFSQEEMQSLFENFDKEKKGFIKYNELFMEIIGNMNILRFTLVKQLFDLFPKNQYGNINFDVFKNSFYPNRHFDVLNGNKTTDEVYGEFLECLQIFKEYITNLKGNISKNDLTYEEFCDFFGEISSEIKNDSIFSNYIENCWKIIN